MGTKRQLRDPKTGRLVWVHEDSIESTEASSASAADENTATATRSSPPSTPPPRAVAVRKRDDTWGDFWDGDDVEDAD
jgi:hypothetical protein